MAQDAISNLSCSTHGTKVVYVNDLPRFNRRNITITKNKLDSRYVNSKFIDRHSKVEVTTLNLPSFGASYDEFAAKELKIRATQVKEPFLFKFLKEAKDPALKVAGVYGLLPTVVIKSVGYLDKIKKFSEVDFNNDAAEELARIFVVSEGSVAEDLDSLVQDEIVTRILPNIENKDKNIYIAHGSGGHFVNVLTREVSKVTNGSELVTQFAEYNKALYVSKDRNSFLPGRYLNFDSDRATNNVLEFPKANYINQIHDFKQWDNFDFLYLGYQKAKERNEPEINYRSVSTIMDEHVFELAKQIKSNCPEVLYKQLNRDVQFSVGKMEIYKRDTLNYEWDFGDGSSKITSTSLPVTHSYDTEGQFQVSIRVFKGTTFLFSMKSTFVLNDQRRFSSACVSSKEDLIKSLKPSIVPGFLYEKDMGDYYGICYSKGIDYSNVELYGNCYYSHFYNCTKYPGIFPDTYEWLLAE